MAGLTPHMLQQMQALSAATPPIVEFKAGLLDQTGEKTHRLSADCHGLVGGAFTAPPPDLSDVRR